MNSIEIFTTALQYEEKIRDLYRSADSIIDDQRGKAIFRALADDEQSHVDFLQYSLQQLHAEKTIDTARLKTQIPDQQTIKENIEQLKSMIPDKMLGDIKTVLSSALKMEKETSDFYREAKEKTEGPIKEIMEKFYEIEERHVDVVQIELDHASNSGIWFNFMEINLETE